MVRPVDLVKRETVRRMGEIKSRLPKESRAALAFSAGGLSLFMGWIYIVFYTPVIWTAGGQATSNYAWTFAMLLSSIVGVIGVAVYGKRRVVFEVISPILFWMLAALCAGGTLLMALCHHADISSEPLVLACASVVAIGFSLLTIVWGSKVSDLGVETIELLVPVAFITARAVLFCIQLAPGQLCCVLVVLLPLASAACLHCAGKGGPQASERESPNEEVSEGGIDLTYGLFSVTVVLLVFRLLRSFMGVVAGGSFGFYDAPAILSFIIPAFGFGAFIAVALLSSRSVNSSVLTRWLIPVVLLAFALAHFRSPEAIEALALVNDLGAVILQAFFWILFAKVGYRCRGGAPVLFSCYLIGIGFGLVAGEVLGHAVLSDVFGIDNLSALSLVVFVSVSVLMAVDGRARQFGRPRVCEYAAELPASVEVSDLDAICRRQAHGLAEAYGLSPREEELVALILAGRSRPYIRDTLYISLNTVNTHIRNAYAKMGVHSQRELLDLARDS